MEREEDIKVEEEIKVEGIKVEGIKVEVEVEVEGDKIKQTLLLH